MALWTIEPRSTLSISRVSLPATMRLMSSRSEMSWACSRVLRATTSRPRCTSAGSPALRAISCVQPRMALSGVRSSCDTIATKSSFTRLARSASAPGRAFRLEQPVAFEDRAFLIGDVARDLRGADHPARRVAHGRDGERHVHQTPVLGDAYGLEVFHPHAVADARDDLVFLGLAFGRNEHADRLADEFMGRIAEQTLRGGVARADGAVEILRDDRVVRRVDDRRQIGALLVLAAQALFHLAEAFLALAQRLLGALLRSDVAAGRAGPFVAGVGGVVSGVGHPQGSCAPRGRVI